MKLYSRGQLIISIICSAAAAFVVAAVLFIFTGKKTSSVENQTAQVESVPVSPDTLTPPGLEQNLESSLAIPVSSNTYSQDEIQNINVYNLCNEAVVNINTKVTSYDWFLEPYVQDGGSGSGSIIDILGYILTNVHVIPGATKIGSYWAIPDDAEKPRDARIKTGKYIKDDSTIRKEI